MEVIIRHFPPNLNNGVGKENYDAIDEKVNFDFRSIHMVFYLPL